MEEERKLMSLTFPSTSYEERRRIVGIVMEFDLDFLFVLENEFGRCESEGFIDVKDTVEGENDE